jgi:hypothetical protein
MMAHTEMQRGQNPDRGPDFKLTRANPDSHQDRVVVDFVQNTARVCNEIPENMKQDRAQYSKSRSCGRHPASGIAFNYDRANPLLEEGIAWSRRRRRRSDGCCSRS